MHANTFTCALIGCVCHCHCHLVLRLQSASAGVFFELVAPCVCTHVRTITLLVAVLFRTSTVDVISTWHFARPISLRKWLIIPYVEDEVAVLDVADKLSHIKGFQR
eukprot:scaffold555280_cov46-Prasinocladus_malaysianus.AAC.1